MPKKSSAWIAGGGSYVALRRFNNAADAVAKKLEATTDNEDAPQPTNDELANLRDRHLESEALSKRSQVLWSLEKKDHNGELFRWGLLLIYRCVVFAAAITILYKNWTP